MMRGATLNIAEYLPSSRANGPGLRAVVWVQGCPFRCPGCWNPSTLPFQPRKLIEVDRLAADILSQKGVDGVTFSGGEPFAQADRLADLGTLLQDAGLSVITFTGYTLDHLLAENREDWRQLLRVTDLLIDGPYDRTRPASDPLRGSKSKRLLFLTPRLVRNPYFQPSEGQTFEIQVEPSGRMTTTGFPPVSGPELRSDLEHAGIRVSKE